MIGGIAMKKTFTKIFSVVLAAIMFLSTIPIVSYASELEYNDLLYEVSDGSVTITGYSNPYTYELNIPSEINGISVTKIAPYAFKDLIGLGKINIPKTVTEIGEYGMATVFEGCYNLYKITVDENNSCFCSIDGVLFHYSTNQELELVQYPLGKSEGSYIIPDGVYGIYAYAFKEKTHPTYLGLSNYLQSVELPECMMWIGYYAFAECLSLKSVTIYPGNVEYTKIAGNAFYGCSDLTDVYFKSTEEKWNNIVIEEGNEPLLNATKHFSDEHTHTLMHIKNAYCTDMGYEYDICTMCNKIFNKVTLHPTGHNLKSVVKDPTCVAKGEKYDICTVCNQKFNFSETAATGHSFGEWEAVKEPTVSENGLEKRSCSKCTESETRLTDKLSLVTDKETGIEMIFSKELDKNTTLTVSQQSDANTFKIINDSYGSTMSKAFNITLFNDNEKVQPNGKITFRIPLPDGYEPDNAFVCYVDTENSKAENITFKITDGYIEFETSHLSIYAVVQRTPSVKAVKVEDAEINYKSTARLNVGIYADEGAKYTVSYSSSAPKTISVDDNGNIHALARGNAEITCTVTDSYGNTVSDTCMVKSNYTFGQWLIKILLFGWIWY